MYILYMIHYTSIIYTYLFSYYIYICTYTYIIIYYVCVCVRGAYTGLSYAHWKLKMEESGEKLRLVTWGRFCPQRNRLQPGFIVQVGGGIFFSCCESFFQVYLFEVHTTLMLKCTRQARWLEHGWIVLNASNPNWWY